jgi:hypothetical protein
MEELKTKADYLTVTSLADDGDPLSGPPSGPSGELARSLPQRLQLLKSFDLRQGWGIGSGLDLPRWASPRVDIYSTLPARAVSNPLALSRPGVGSERSYAVIYGQGPDYSRADNAIWLGEPGVGQRVLRLNPPPARLGLYLSNLGQDLAWLEVGLGLGLRRRVSLYPGQMTHLSLDPSLWPPMADGFNTVSVFLRRGGGVLARFDWDSLLLGRAALKDGRYQEAVVHLNRATGSEGGFDAQALLAGSLARLGRLEEASRALATLAGADEEPLKTYQTLAG